MKFEFRPDEFVEVKLTKNYFGLHCLECKEITTILFKIVTDARTYYTSCPAHVEHLLSFFAPSARRIVVSKRFKRQLAVFKRRYKSYIALGKL